MRNKRTSNDNYDNDDEKNKPPGTVRDAAEAAAQEVPLPLGLLLGTRSLGRRRTRVHTGFSF